MKESRLLGFAYAAAADADDRHHYSGQGDDRAGDRPEGMAGHGIVTADIAQALQGEDRSGQQDDQAHADEQCPLQGSLISRAWSPVPNPSSLIRARCGKGSPALGPGRLGAVAGGSTQLRTGKRGPGRLAGARRARPAIRAPVSYAIDLKRTLSATPSTSSIGVDGVGDRIADLSVA